MERTVRKLGGREREELQESIDIARSEISRLDSIVTQFLRAIRPSKPQLHPENVNTIVEEAVRFFTPRSRTATSWSSRSCAPICRCSSWIATR
jgi:signal transduction histidine kinase